MARVELSKANAPLEREAFVSAADRVCTRVRHAHMMHLRVRLIGLHIHTHRHHSQTLVARLRCRAVGCLTDTTLELVRFSSQSPVCNVTPWHDAPSPLMPVLVQVTARAWCGPTHGRFCWLHLAGRASTGSKAKVSE